MRIPRLVLSLAAIAGCGVSRELLGELPQSEDDPPDAEVYQEPDAARDAWLDAAADGGEPSAEPEPSLLDSGVSADMCAPSSCDANALPLSAYCDLAHAQCPRGLAEARTRSCAEILSRPRFSLVPLVSERALYANGCGGKSLHVQYLYGLVEYHFGADDTLRAVTTQTALAAGPCKSLLYRYGDPTCTSFSQREVISCDP